MSLRRVAGPYDYPAIPNLHVSSFCVIPETGQPDKWRLILDLSSLRDFSVFDDIDPDRFSLQYVNWMTSVWLLVLVLIAKFVIEHAYRKVAVHPSQRRTVASWHNRK